MRFFLIASLIASAAAIDSLSGLTDQLPECAIQCLVTAVTDQGCAITDVTCQCSNLQGIIESASPCLVQAGCAIDDLSNASSKVADFCATQVTGTPASGPSATPTPVETPVMAGGPSNFRQGSMWSGAVAAVAVALL
ncbi:hypothetical protein ACJ41O_005298 [Fusarium nematophilum]